MTEQTPKWDHLPTNADYHDYECPHGEGLSNNCDGCFLQTRLTTLEGLIRDFVKARKAAEQCSELLLSGEDTQVTVDLMWDLTKAEKALEDAVQ